MTWEEFKESMDKQIEEKGIPKTTQMGWIDWSPALMDEPTIWYDDEINELHIS